ncbi:MAG TPA: XkdF-like putative serine protease domain-containing protein [Thermodesulfobacteriota bacterium]|nr:XkdF-like putative serine protease domain-containing protein [Thermodesulfobacteriota bacterium]
MKETKIVELVIADDSQELAIDAISLVNSPAIEQDFVFFGKEKNNLTFAKVDEEKRMLVSPALIPNKQIFRYDPNTDSEYYVFFSKSTVAKAAYLYLKHNNHHKATYEHKDRVSGVLTVESWIKEGDSDKSKMYGYDLPNGTWFVKMKIENEDLWNKIKEGELKGLSIEGYFTNKFEEMQKQQPTPEQILSALNEIIQESKKTELKAEKVELGIADDVKKIEKEVFSVDEKLILKNILAPLRKGMSEISKIVKLENKLETSLKKAKSQLKELGVSEKNVPWVESGESTLRYINDTKKLLKTLDKTEKTLTVN